MTFQKSKQVILLYLHSQDTNLDCVDGIRECMHSVRLKKSKERRVLKEEDKGGNRETPIESGNGEGGEGKEVWGNGEIPAMSACFASCE